MKFNKNNRLNEQYLLKLLNPFIGNVNSKLQNGATDAQKKKKNSIFDDNKSKNSQKDYII